MNNLLSSGKPIPLEFLINGSYLRTSLDEYLTTNGISAETTLTAEYVRALTPPTFVASFQHDDWVSSVDVLPGSQTRLSSNPGIGIGSQKILSGSYDGFLRVWSTSGQILATSPSSSDSVEVSFVTDAKFISPTQLASSHFERTIRIWDYGEEEDGFSGSIKPRLELYGHKSSVDSISVHAPSSRILSASSDHSVGLWTMKESEAPDAPASLLPSAASKSAKRRKLNSPTQFSRRGPVALLKQHSQQVLGATFDFKDPTVGYSVSWDHTVRTWDLVTTALVDTRTTSAALFSLTHLPGLNLVAAGSSARYIALIDPRDSATTVSAMTLRGHWNTVSTLARDPESEYGLISGSYDGTCRVWDVRSKRRGKDGIVGESIYTIEREAMKGQPKREGGQGVKVFGVCWDKNIGIVSASEDKTLQINKGDGLVSNRDVST